MSLEVSFLFPLLQALSSFPTIICPKILGHSYSLSLLGVWQDRSEPPGQCPTQRSLSTKLCHPGGKLTWIKWNFFSYLLPKSILGCFALLMWLNHSVGPLVSHKLILIYEWLLKSLSVESWRLGPPVPLSCWCPSEPLCAFYISFRIIYLSF